MKRCIFLLSNVERVFFGFARNNILLSVSIMVIGVVVSIINAYLGFFIFLLGIMFFHYRIQFLDKKEEVKE